MAQEKELYDFVDLVIEMRNAQKAYFRNRDTNDLLKSKELEGKVDKMAKDILSTTYAPSLFEQRQEDCPLVEIKPHGRLLDEDTVLDELMKSVIESNADAYWVVKNTPAIVGENNG